MEAKGRALVENCLLMFIGAFIFRGDGFFSGPYFARPREIQHEPARMFYPREVFGVEQPDITVPMENIQGLCAVLTLKDYVKCMSIVKIIKEK